MKPIVGIAISVVLLLSLAISVYLVGDSDQPTGGSGSAGIASETILEIDELANVSELVVLGEPESSEVVTKEATDTSQPEHLRGPKQVIELSRVTFTVDEYFKGSGPKIINVTMPAASHFQLLGNDGTLKEEITYVLFLFDPNLRGSGDFWGDTYLTQGLQGTWQVNGSSAERIAPPASLTLDDLRNQVAEASDTAQ